MGLEFHRLFPQSPAPVVKIGRLQHLIHPRPVFHQASQANSIVHQQFIFGRFQPLRRQVNLMQGIPEPIALAGEILMLLGRYRARGRAAEDDEQIVVKQVRQHSTAIPKSKETMKQEEPLFVNIVIWTPTRKQKEVNYESYHIRE
jgi:hypothetical protein